MAHALDGSRFKVARAQEHLDAFKAETRQYMETPVAQPVEAVLDGELAASSRSSTSSSGRGRRRRELRPTPGGASPSHSLKAWAQVLERRTRDWLKVKQAN